VDIALACDADGVQVPEKGLPIEAIRPLLRAHMQVGASCHDAAGLRRAAHGGAHFATLAPVFEVPGKNPALGIEGFRSMCAEFTLPVVALGGIGRIQIPDLLIAGARGISLIREVFDAADPAQTLAECLDAVRNAKFVR
jgi:thiamine-phosphate pyrophosphorylase